MPCPSVYRMLEVVGVEVPRPCLAAVVQDEATPGARGAPAARALGAWSTRAPSATSTAAAAAIDCRAMRRLRACAHPACLSRRPQAVHDFSPAFSTRLPARQLLQPPARERHLPDRPRQPPPDRRG